jgi:phospholipid-transporting ATPase
MVLGYHSLPRNTFDRAWEGSARFGVSLLCLCVLTHDLHILISIWTKYTAAAIPGSFVFTMLFLPLYATIAPIIGFSMEYQGIVPRLWTNAVFYLVLILTPLVCLARDFTWK